MARARLSPAFVFTVLGLSAYFWFRPKAASASVLANRPYRYTALFTPALHDPDEVTRLGAAIKAAGNQLVRIDPYGAEYDVVRQSSVTLTEGQLLTDFEGHHVIFQSARAL